MNPTGFKYKPKEKSKDNVFEKLHKTLLKNVNATLQMRVVKAASGFL